MLLNYLQNSKYLPLACYTYTVHRRAIVDKKLIARKELAEENGARLFPCLFSIPQRSLSTRYSTTEKGENQGWRV